MKRNLLLLLLFSTLFISCRRQVEDRIFGQWKLDQSFRRDFLDRDYFTTGYEDGVFTFNESGTASYTSATDTLTGYWEADFYNRGYYDGNGDWQNQRQKYLRIYLVNFQANEVFNLNLDEFNFRNNWNCIRGTQYSYGRDRIYEFVRL
ncbi:MAG: hypothetical protein SFU20_08670 [Chitinophagaceae bacterium]|nr:hypothetical protein [Chitinophagaceae bacterium]